ncbi:hypothetical protein Bhyg_07472 [Pseudolycoriella hygida]|uniref:Uncharacterized protein n=1 Tax=Pseudolycoriella hygida TaxID=35572 RepID=A0A9Q0N3M7_9DIPT|nr:hypothetical protein Bhyg_07472 [Pseudolycoriella hygida]
MYYHLVCKRFATNEMNSIFVTILFACLAGLVFTDEASDLKQKFQQVHLSCSARTLFNPIGIKYLIDLNFNAAQRIPNHDCFEKCVFQSIGTVTPTGLDNNKILALAAIFQPQTIPQTQIQLAKCSSLYNPNNFDCAAAWRLYLCLQNGESTLSQPKAPTCAVVRAAWN